MENNLSISFFLKIVNNISFFYYVKLNTDINKIMIFFIEKWLSPFSNLSRIALAKAILEKCLFSFYFFGYLMYFLFCEEFSNVYNKKW